MINDRKYDMIEEINIPPIIDRRISGLESSYSYLKDTMKEIVEKLNSILEQSTKVAILAEKQANHAIDLERAERRIVEVEAKYSTLHTQVSEFISFIRGLTKLAYILWTSLGAVVFLILIKILFFLGKQGFMP